LLACSGDVTESAIAGGAGGADAGARCSIPISAPLHDLPNGNAGCTTCGVGLALCIDPSTGACIKLGYPLECPNADDDSVTFQVDKTGTGSTLADTFSVYGSATMTVGASSHGVVGEGSAIYQHSSTDVTLRLRDFNGKLFELRVRRDGTTMTILSLTLI
jgi:hypothetical protein